MLWVSRNWGGEVCHHPARVVPFALCIPRFDTPHLTHATQGVVRRCICMARMALNWWLCPGPVLAALAAMLRFSRFDAFHLRTQGAFVRERRMRVAGMRAPLDRRLCPDLHV